MEDTRWLLATWTASFEELDTALNLPEDNVIWAKYRVQVVYSVHLATLDNTIESKPVENMFLIETEVQLCQDQVKLWLDVIAQTKTIRLQ